MGIFRFLVSLVGGRLNLLLYSVLLGSVGALGIYLFIYINEAAENKILVQELRKDIVFLEQELDAKDRVIEIQEENILIINEVLDERDDEIQFLKVEFDKLRMNLGEDASDSAPESLKELIRRLKEREKENTEIE